MAFRRNLITTTTWARLLAQQRFRFNPPSTTIPYHVHHHHEEDRRSESFPPFNCRSYSGFCNTTAALSLSFRDDPIGGFLFARNMSSLSPIPSTEVAAAAADSWLTVAALQYAIDGVHIFTGLNWWAGIVITTLVIRTLSIPIMINQLKTSTKMKIMGPRLEEIHREMQDRGMSSSAVAEGTEKIKTLYKRHDINMFTSLKGILIQGPVFVSFFLAIQNMVEKVPSFKTGGASWFLDLTTPDPFYLLPCLSAFTFWLIVEFNMQEGMKGNPYAGMMKNIGRAFAVFSVPLTATFPKALFCYWITSNLFSLVYGSIIKNPTVKKKLNIPVLLPSPPPREAVKSKGPFHPRQSFTR